jgi:hypothetical protein
LQCAAKPVHPSGCLDCLHICVGPIQVASDDLDVFGTDISLPL